MVLQNLAETTHMSNTAFGHADKSNGGETMSFK